MFDGEVGVVQHLGDQAVAKAVALDRLVFVHGTDSLNHLCGNTEQKISTDALSRPLQQADNLLLYFCHLRLPGCNGGWITPDEIYALFIPGV